MNLFDTFSDPTLMHAAVVHLPLALSVFGVVLLVLSAIFHRSNAVRGIALVAYIMLAGSSFVAEESGEEAQSKISNEAPGAVWELVNDHEAMAHRVQLAGIATCIFLAVSLLPHAQVRVGMLLLATVGGLVTALLGAFTGHMGGALVYAYGVGTPTPAWVAAPGDGAAAPAMEGDGVDGEEGEVVILEVMEIDITSAGYVSYEADVLPIFQEFCIDCHESPDPDGGYDMSTVATMLQAGEKAGPGIIPGNPDASPVVQYIRGLKRPQMPKGEAPLDIFALHTVREWIAAGAKDDSAGASAVPEAAAEEAMVEVDPEAAAPDEPEPVPAEAAMEDPASAAEAVATEAAAPVVEEPAPVEAVMEEAAPAAEALPTETAVDVPAPEAETAPEEVVMEEAAPAVEGAIPEAEVEAPAVEKMTPEAVEVPSAPESEVIAPEAPAAPAPDTEAAPEKAAPVEEIEDAVPAEELPPAVENEEVAPEAAPEQGEVLETPEPELPDQGTILEEDEVVDEGKQADEKEEQVEERPQALPERSPELPVTTPLVTRRGVT